MINIDPGRIVHIPMRGSGNVASPLQWGVRWTLLDIRINFKRMSASGTETATFTVAVDDPTYTENNWTPITIPGAGVSAPIHWRPHYDELHAWTFRPETRLLMAWTNPDAIEICWGGEVLIYPHG